MESGDEANIEGSASFRKIRLSCLFSMFLSCRGCLAGDWCLCKVTHVPSSTLIKGTYRKQALGGRLRSGLPLLSLVLAVRLSCPSHCASCACMDFSDFPPRLLLLGLASWLAVSLATSDILVETCVVHFRSDGYPAVGVVLYVCFCHRHTG